MTDVEKLNAHEAPHSVSARETREVRILGAAAVLLARW